VSSSQPYLHKNSDNAKHPLSALVGVPKMEMFESPASWICQAALSQGATREEFAEFLGLRKQDDPDLAFVAGSIGEFAVRCGVPRAHFEFASYMFGGLASIDPNGERFLSEYQRAARYRYCPVCLHDSKVKHFMVHWRFSAWRYCPDHDCLMVDACKHCGEYITLPTDMLKGGFGGYGIASLDYCMACGHRLSSHWKQALGEMHRLHLGFAEKTAYAYGRAVLAAIYHRRVRYINNGMYHNVGLKFLINFDELGLIPNKDSEFPSFSSANGTYAGGG